MIDIRRLFIYLFTSLTVRIYLSYGTNIKSNIEPKKKFKSQVRHMTKYLVYFISICICIRMFIYVFVCVYYKEERGGRREEAEKVVNGGVTG